MLTMPPTTRRRGRRARVGHARHEPARRARTTGSPRSTTHGAGAWSRTSPSTSPRRGRRPAAPASPVGTPVVELGVGTGRIAVPIAAAGIAVIGVDSSPAMLAVCRATCRGGGRLRPARPPGRRLPRPAGDRARRARHVPLPRVPAPARRRRRAPARAAAPRATCSCPAAGSRSTSSRRRRRTSRRRTAGGSSASRGSGSGPTGTSERTAADARRSRRADGAR